MIDYLEGLNEPQRQAVLHTNGPLMIVAGAGSGKTRVLTHRIAHLMKQGIEPFNIMALTFTNKAAGEMRQRIEKIAGTDARSLWMGTFHAVFARILRVEAQKLGFDSNFTIYDTDDSKSLIKTIVKEMNLDDKIYRPNTVLSRISTAKNSLISAQYYADHPIFRADDEAYRRPYIANIYAQYQQRCFKANAMDFDDLLYHTNILLRQHLDVLHKYQHKFQYVLIDEFQDTNHSQYMIVKRLAAVHQNICVVGDDAQSIYAFRGADIRNILDFEKDYPELITIRLEQNYRSTGHIVEAANSLIAHNQKQIQKRVWTDNEEGERIRVLKAYSDTEEATRIAESIFEEKNHHALRNTDFAILYRTNAQSRALEEALRRKEMKYRLIGGLSFYQRKEIKDLVAYLRYVVNPNDEEAFKRIVNYPKRGIGSSSILKLLVAAQDHDLPLWETVLKAEHFLPARASKSISEFAVMIKGFQLSVQKKDAYHAAAEIARMSGLLEELYEDKTVEGMARYENTQELLNAIKEFVDNPENEDKGLAAFLQQVSLLTSAEDPKNQDEDCITLMTIHASKGLEFRNVYITGMEENLFPSSMMINSRAELEEERRLFYVAMTRAQKRLTLSYANTRYQYGQLQNCEPSRFLDEIDAKHLYTDHGRASSSFSTNQSFVRQLQQKPSALKPSQLAKPHTPSENFAASDPTALQVGMRVEHKKFGYGTVQALDAQGSDRKARIDFEHHGEKTLLLSFAKLKIHS
jgi:DNA helicase-2/ATP-dependent DNA helicase PcrA